MNYFPTVEEAFIELLKIYWPHLYLLIGLYFCLQHIMEEVGDAAIAWLLAWPLLLPIDLVKRLVWSIRKNK